MSSQENIKNIKASGYAKILGAILTAFGAAVIITVAYRNSHKAQQPVVFSDRDMLDGLWNEYKANDLDVNNHRTYDRSRNDATTSEAESYTMIRSVIWDDKTTFDESWSWTQANLQHKSGDSLFSWYYGQLPEGNYGVNASTGGNNSAADGDEDIALSLIFAYDRWGQSNYLDSAKQIISSIWQNEVVTIHGTPYLLADNVELSSNKGYYVVNPSYLAPADYRIFAKYDTARNWNALADSSYTILNESMDSNLDKKSTVELPPDWLALNSSTAAISSVPNNSSLDTNYGYDAMRVPFRLALDYKWFGSQQALATLQKMSFLKNQWQSKNLLYTIYAHDGSVLSSQESPSIYGGDLGYFELIDQGDASQIYNQKLKSLYQPDTNSWNQSLGYYDDNWAWLGLALHGNFIINLDAGK